MSTDNKSKLQQLATFEDRQSIFRMLKARKKIEVIASPFQAKGDDGIERCFSILEAALLPELFENLPKFDLNTRQFSDETFAKELPLLNYKVSPADFNEHDLETLNQNGIYRIWQFLAMKTLPDLQLQADSVPNFFSFAFCLPVIFTEEQQAQLIE
jgi:hypothetical protein